MIYSDFLPNIINYKLLNKIKLRISRGVVHLKPKEQKRGSVLMSYSTLPFVTRKSVQDGHTNRWECMEIANIFLRRGYDVDVIDWTNKNFIPTKKYDWFFDIHSNLARLAPQLGDQCIKILHLTTSAARFQNSAENERIESLKKRRGVTLKARRQIEETESIKFADAVSMLGSEKTAATYDFAHTKIELIPISTTHTFSFSQNKNFEESRKNFIWFGGSGVVHKGLDLVVEAFVQMPEYKLTVCGKVLSETDFAEAYKKELTETKNISVVGLIDPGSEEFKKIVGSSVALVYPSSSEGQSGAVVTMMHAGIIPIVSEYSGMNVGDFGITLLKNDIDEIKEAVKRIATMPTEELQAKSVKCWKYANKNHTRENFSKSYERFIESVAEKFKK